MKSELFEQATNDQNCSDKPHMIRAVLVNHKCQESSDHNNGND